MITIDSTTLDAAIVRDQYATELADDLLRRIGGDWEDSTSTKDCSQVMLTTEQYFADGTVTLFVTSTDAAHLFRITGLIVISGTMYELRGRYAADYDTLRDYDYLLRSLASEVGDVFRAAVPGAML